MKTRILIVTLLMGSIAFAQAPEKGKGQEKKEDKTEQKGNQNNPSKDKDQDKGKPAVKENTGQDKKDQNPKANDKGKPEEKLKEKSENKGNAKSDNGKEKEDKETASGKDKEHPGQGHAYGKNKGELTGREFGQARAAAAKAKHEETKPVNKEEVQIVIRETSVRNKVLLSETERKLQEAIEILEKRRKEGTIKPLEYEQKLKTIEDLKKKRATIELKVN